MSKTHSIEMEKAVLGRLMTFPDYYHVYASSLSVESFYNENHREIYAAMKTLADKKVINPISLEFELREKPAPHPNWAYYLLAMQEQVASDNMDYYVAQLIELERKRRIEHMLLQARAIDMGQPLHEVIGQLGAIYAHATQDAGNQTKTTQEQISGFLKQLQEPNENRILTSVKKLNKLTAGYRRGNLIIYAARPGMGKTAMMVGDVMSACKAGKEVHVVSSEMTAEELIERMVVQISGIDGEKVRTKNLSDEDWKAINKATAQIEKWKMTIDESTYLPNILSRAKAEGARRKLDLIVVDYIQRIVGTKDKREQEVNEITTSFKNIAKSLNTVVIALAQLNRNLEHRSDRRPMLSDLRESGAIEQEADMVMFLHRPEEYRQFEWEDGSSAEGQGEFIIAKYRAGKTGKIRVGWDGSRMRYTDLEERIPENLYTPF